MTDPRGSAKVLLGLALLGLLALVGLWTGWSVTASTWMAGTLSDLIIGLLEQQQ